MQVPIAGSSLVKNGVVQATLSYTSWAAITQNNAGLSLKKLNINRYYFSDKAYFDIDSKWLSAFTVVNNDDESSWEILSHSVDTAEFQQTLAFVKIIKTDDIEKYTTNGYFPIYSNYTDKAACVYKITNYGEQFGIVASNFVSIQ
ncbi:hypothetical protein SDC9_170939 [bioreactor metagenome]|uniref:Uncharacterized protein n=1 Tax=bioreactor metagenome TaxID=1076179 RepID=A0A645G9G5_9ZZZZ